MADESCGWSRYFNCDPANQRSTGVLVVDGGLTIPFDGYQHVTLEFPAGTEYMQGWGGWLRFDVPGMRPTVTTGVTPVTDAGIRVNTSLGPEQSLTCEDGSQIGITLVPAYAPAPREWRGNLCGIRVPGLPRVVGGADDPSLVLTWLYFRYGPDDRAKIRAAYKTKGLTHVTLSWPDARAAGVSPDAYAGLAAEWSDDGCFPCHFMCSKDFDAPDVNWIMASVQQVIPTLVRRRLMPLMSIGWELSLWLSPEQVQELINRMTAMVDLTFTKPWCHFQQGYSSFQRDGGTFADFWNPNVGKLCGLLHQKILEQTPEQYRTDSGGIEDVLTRFAGNFYCSPDSGFGHPFDFIAFELTAQDQYQGTCTEAQGDALGAWAMGTPAQSGPNGVTVGVMGFGNGA